jgi:GPH family glycoside/pentoside/hexuronide:cation symporter
VVGALKNRALISIIIASVLMLISQFTMQQMANYVFPDYYANTAAQSASTFAMMGGMIVAAIFARPLAVRFGKAEISVFSNLLAAAVSLALFFIRPRSVWVYVGISSLSWLGLGIFSMVSWALITDVIDYSEIKNGVREDGSIYALYSFSRKLGQAGAAGLVGLFLSLIGYEKVSGAILSNSVREGIFSLSTLVHAIGFILLAAVLWFWYPLNKREVDKNIMILKEKHSAE